MKRVLIIALIVTLAGTSYGQSLSFRCKFSDGQVTDFDRGIPRVKRSSDLTDIVFDQVDLRKGSARMIGNAGAETVRVLMGTGSLHLIEITGYGNLNITTIFYEPGESALQSIPVVHSRHVGTQRGPLPSQYLGQCSRLL
jgi:hypothetical protein